VRSGARHRGRPEGGLLGWRPDRLPPAAALPHARRAGALSAHKALRWRARPRGHDWLSNVILIAPSAALLERLPNRKLPDRNDFYHYGTDHAARIAVWNRAIAECERFADAAMAWLQRPDLAVARPL